jgi:hypothetical protein
VTYSYCSPSCRRRHAEAVAEVARWCACGEPVFGDALVCAEHLDGAAAAEVGFLLAG